LNQGKVKGLAAIIFAVPGRLLIPVDVPAMAFTLIEVPVGTGNGDLMMLTLKVNGMTCDHCVGTVTEAVHGVDPAAQVQVDLATGLVKVESAKRRAELARAVEDAGYSVESA
jgi:copper chaperone